MKIPYSWLKSYVDISVDIETFAKDMTMAGSIVEGIHRMGAEITGVVVGRINSVTQHPNADKLVVCMIDIGESEPIQIITGATNIYEGACIPVALHGANLANGLKIKRGKIRGEISDGMLCSIEELGYSKNEYPEAPENGIYIFSEEQALKQSFGADARIALELLEDIAEFELTSNRPDCFSVVGIAREAAAVYNLPLKLPQKDCDTEYIPNTKEDVNRHITVEIKNSELCPRYIARVVKNVKIEPSPQWMRTRLIAAGLRPVNNIVDITNYVMLEFGQPMHAFDITAIEGRIIVRNALDGETITTLDGTQRALDSSMLVIADVAKAVGIAGVMGGENSKITGYADAILFESANFNGANIRQTAKKLGLRTDSSSRYEKGLDPNIAEIAVNRAIQLVEELGCGTAVEGMVDNYPNPRRPRYVKYSADSVNNLLGTAIPQNQMIDILAKLEIPTIAQEAEIPTFRYDIEQEADIAEEIARIYGYDNIPMTIPKGANSGKKNQLQKSEELLKTAMVAQGYSESLSYAFESPRVYEKLLLDIDNINPVRIINPLGEDYSVMRTTVIPSMLNSLALNFNRRNESAALFEITKIYKPSTEKPEEYQMLAMGCYGNTDFFDMKGAIENIFETFGIMPDFVPEINISYMHPGKTATIICNDVELGYFGEVHPKVLENYGISATVYAGEIKINEFFHHANTAKSYVPLPKFPGISRDIALIVKEDITAAAISNEIRNNGGKFLKDVRLFDVFRGDALPEGCKSMALRLSFRADERTLKDEEIIKTMEKILKALEISLDAKLR